MKINYKHILSLVTMGVACGLTLPCLAGPGVYFVAPAPPTIVITAPAPPPPAMVVVVPDTYMWDGDEYVGIVGDQYYYLGPDRIWIVMDPVRLHRFQLYVHDNPDWRGQMIRNEKYRDHDRDRDRDRDRAEPMHNDRPMNDHRDHDDHHGPPK